MLSHILIRNFAIIPALELEIPAGFTAITGETGAGKSMLVDALGLLLGDRSDATWVRTGAERAELTAEFRVSGNTEALQWLHEAELGSDDTCLLRRTISSQGRSRAFINGSPVTVAQMQSLGNLLVEIHGQNEHLRLNRTSEQFKLLDRSGDYAGQLDAVRAAFKKWQSVKDELESLESEGAVSETDMDFLKFQLDELQQYDLSPDAINRLQTEHDRLAAGGSLLEALSHGMELLDPESPGISAGVNADIHQALSRLREFASLDKNIAEACQMLDEALVNCNEATQSLRAAYERVELDPDRFEQVASMLGRIHDLSRKHRVRMEDMQEVRDNLARRIERAGTADQLRRSLQEQLDHCQGIYREASRQLHEARAKHASVLSGRVNELMAELGMAGGLFELKVTLNPHAAPSQRGDDDIQIMISANPGHAPGPLSKIASGGELSRISLAIKVAAAGGSQATTQVFDEVDAGIGGDTANAVGKLLRRLSSSRLKGSGQALCVTHLAQVAVCAASHLKVHKGTDNDSTTVSTVLLANGDRVDEIARMLSGNVSAQSRAHAAELLENAGLTDQART